jgi:tRNA (cmo5U34)-methyltransferase
MQQHELDTLFDRQAAGYDAQWTRMAPIRESLHFLLDTVFADLPEDTRLLCVGAGTGAEIAHLAKRFPRWHFLALDPAPGMIDACRVRAERDGFADRCEFHGGLVETLPDTAAFNGATCFLVSQFILAPEARTRFFRDIGERMRAGYARDVAILPPDKVASLVADAGFEAPLRFHQAGMIHGWCARRMHSPT